MTGELEPNVTVGIFVGGASSRMGTPKGLLAHPRGGTLLEHLITTCEEAALACVLVGRADPYVDIASHVPRLADAFEGAGPIAGLAALVAHVPIGVVISVACDMPHVDATTLRALARDPRRAAVIAAPSNASGVFEPMLARWDATRTAAAIATARAAGDHSLQRLMRGLGVEAFDADTRAAIDWDTPEDVGR